MAFIYYFLLYTENFMTQNDSDFSLHLLRRFFERNGVVGLLYGIDGVTLFFQRLDGFQGILVVLPFYAFFRSQSRLMDLLVRRAATDPAQHHFLNAHGIRSAEYSTHIMLAANVVQHYH